MDTVVPADELELAVARHATSKLRNEGDLDAITTLGFRGEALYSIAAVSRMTLSSRAPGSDAGAEVLVEGGSVQHHRPAGLPVGTVVTVENIFFNVPARRKFLRRPATEAEPHGGDRAALCAGVSRVPFPVCERGQAGVFHWTATGA